jgi:hypothetical protein
MTTAMSVRIEGIYSDATIVIGPTTSKNHAAYLIATSTPPTMMDSGYVHAVINTKFVQSVKRK